MSFAIHPATLALALAMAAVGFAFGLLYFAALRRSVARLVVTGLTTERSWVEPVVLTLGRWAATALLLAIAARWGAASLLATFTGFLLARLVATRAARGPT